MFLRVLLCNLCVAHTVSQSRPALISSSNAFSFSFLLAPFLRRIASASCFFAVALSLRRVTSLSATNLNITTGRAAVDRCERPSLLETSPDSVDASSSEFDTDSVPRRRRVRFAAVAPALPLAAALRGLRRADEVADAFLFVAALSSPLCVALVAALALLLPVAARTDSAALIDARRRPTPRRLLPGSGRGGGGISTLVESSPAICRFSASMSISFAFAARSLASWRLTHSYIGADKLEHFFRFFCSFRGSEQTKTRQMQLTFPSATVSVTSSSS